MGVRVVAWVRSEMSLTPEVVPRSVGVAIAKALGMLHMNYVVPPVYSPPLRLVDRLGYLGCVCSTPEDKGISCTLNVRK